jgi:hypothetical protein
MINPWYIEISNLEKRGSVTIDLVNDETGEIKQLTLDIQQLDNLIELMEGDTITWA